LFGDFEFPGLIYWFSRGLVLNYLINSLLYSWSICACFNTLAWSASISSILFSFEAGGKLSSTETLEGDACFNGCF
jgi:hypothetical protein